MLLAVLPSVLPLSLNSARLSSVSTEGSGHPASQQSLLHLCVSLRRMGLSIGTSFARSCEAQADKRWEAEKWMCGF